MKKLMILAIVTLPLIGCGESSEKKAIRTQCDKEVQKLENALKHPDGLEIDILKAEITATKKHCDCILENISNSDAKAMLENRITSGLTKAELKCQSI